MMLDIRREVAERQGKNLEAVVTEIRLAVALAQIRRRASAPGARVLPVNRAVTPSVHPRRRARSGRDPASRLHAARVTCLADWATKRWS